MNKVHFKLILFRPNQLEAFHSDSDLDVVVDNKENAFKCDKCENSFEMRDDLKRHEKTHFPINNFHFLRPIKMNIKMKITSLASKLKKKYKRKSMQQYRCNICQKPLNTSRGVRIHEKKMHFKKKPELVENFPFETSETNSLVYT